MEPKFVNREEFKIVGMECVGNNQNGEFGKLWHDFLGRMGEVKNAKPGVCYGLCSCGPECKPEEGICKCEETGVFSYIAAVEVSGESDIPEGMVTKTVPAAKFAVFTHKGSLDKLGETWNYIFQTWMKDSGCEIGGSFSFELYDERFDPASENSEIDIYVPVK